jgi:hypothetical protein
MAVGGELASQTGAIPRIGRAVERAKDGFTTERPSITAMAVTPTKTPLTPTKSIRDVGSETVSIFPEPRPESGSVRSGAVWSVPREQLQSAAMRGTPGAGDVLQNTGKTVLYEPRGAIGTGKSVTRFTSEGVPIQEGLPQGNPTPFGGKSIRDLGAPGLRREVQEFVTPSKAMMTPE